MGEQSESCAEGMGSQLVLSYILKEDGLLTLHDYPISAIGCIKIVTDVTGSFLFPSFLLEIVTDGTLLPFSFLPFIHLGFLINKFAF